MIVSIHQPAYLPWLGYFDKIARADLFIWLDNVQFQKNSFQNRNKILSAAGPIWLTVPVQTSGVLYTSMIKDMKIDNSRNWRAKHLAALQQNYARAACFAERLPAIGAFYDRSWDRLDDLCWQMLDYFNNLLGVTTPIRRASEIDCAQGNKSDLVLNLCRAASATKYISGALGRDYLKLDDFAAAGIAVEFQDYVHPVYAQTQSGFTPYLGIVDLLLNEREPLSVLRQHA